MPAGHGYKARYDYVDLTVEEQGGQWRIALRDNRHGVNVAHDETFDSADDAKEAALAAAQHHINVQYNDTLLASSKLNWQEY